MYKFTETSCFWISFRKVDATVKKSLKINTHGRMVETMHFEAQTRYSKRISVNTLKYICVLHNLRLFYYIYTQNDERHFASKQKEYDWDTTYTISDITFVG